MGLRLRPTIDWVPLCPRKGYPCLALGHALWTHYPQGGCWSTLAGASARADAAACALLGLSETGTVLGREVRSLVARGDRPRWPEPWPGPGLTWTGALRFEVAKVSVALVVEMVGLVSGEGWAIRLTVPAGGALPEMASSVTPVPSDAPLSARPTLPAGMTARYLRKPFDADALMTAVHEVLRSRV